MIDILQNLNPPQRLAVEHTDGPLLVFAGAGSGKTRVITHRIAYLVRVKDVRPWNILAVTFTNKAAGEMRTRVAELLGQELRDTWIGTFHATCARLLRLYSDLAGLKKDFVIYDDADQKAMVKRCIRDLDIDEKKFAPRAIQTRINEAKQECIGPDEYEANDFFTDQVAKVFRFYDQRMTTAGALDFGDLLFRMVQLLERSGETRKLLQNRFRYLLVDEYQDTNHVQYRLLKQLTGPERNICVVGDDDQSIYRWRGADVRNILGFRKDHPDAEVVTLEQNYRSTGVILKSAVAVIKKNRTRAPKTLWTENENGEPLRIATLTDEREEAAHVISSVKAELENGRKPGDIAVFYRINAQARVLEEAFRAHNIPYRVIGGMKFYERAEIKDVVAYLRILHNPENDIDLVRIINTPSRKIGATTVNKLLERASRKRHSLFTTIGEVIQSNELPAATRKRLTNFYELMTDLRDLATTMGPAELTVNVLERTQYLEVLKAQDTPEAESRYENIQELVGSFELFERENDDPSLPVLLESISLVQDVDNMDDTPDMVTLMTVHSAKGLEFPSVYLTGMEEDIFPYRRMSDELDDLERTERLEEERRLCYVAITRARQRLTLTNVARRRLFGTERYGLASRFLDDIPKDFVEIIDRRSTTPSLGFGASNISFSAGQSPPPRRKRTVPTKTPEWAKGLLPQGDNSGSGSAVGFGRPHSKASSTDEPHVELDSPGSSDDETPDSGFELRPGMSVKHPKYGVGRVDRVDAGFTPKVVVEFVGHGRKTIIAKYLQPA